MGSYWFQSNFWKSSFNRSRRFEVQGWYSNHFGMDVRICVYVKLFILHCNRYCRLLFYFGLITTYGACKYINVLTYLVCSKHESAVSSKIFNLSIAHANLEFQIPKIIVYVSTKWRAKMNWITRLTKYQMRVDLILKCSTAFKAIHKTSRATIEKRNTHMRPVANFYFFRSHRPVEILAVIVSRYCGMNYSVVYTIKREC